MSSQHGPTLFLCFNLHYNKIFTQVGNDLILNECTVVIIFIYRNLFEGLFQVIYLQYSYSLLVKQWVSHNNQLYYFQDIFKLLK